MSAPVTNEKFPYEPLVDQDFPIRVLQVEAGDISEPLYCTLVNYADATERGWTCLSYTWGTEPPSTEISINGTSFPVRTNVYNFLREAQRQGLTNLWIDSICINQSDTDERNAQVALMSRIYSEAKLVIVWLGQTSPALERAIKHLASNFPADTSTIRAAAAQPVCCQLSAAECSSLFEACGAEIWTRRWIKQEIMLPERVVLHCGETSISISVFFAAMDALVDYSTLHNHTTPDSKTSSSVQEDGSKKKEDEPKTCFYDENSFDQLHRQCANVLAFHSATRPKGWKKQLPLLLKMFENSVCTDFHDHVYAFRGIMEQGMLLPVDYNNSRNSMLLDTLDFIAQTTHPRLRGASAAERDLLVDLYRGFDITEDGLEHIFGFFKTILLLQVGYNFDMLRKDISVWTFLDSVTDRDEFLASPWREKEMCRACGRRVLNEQEMDDRHTVLSQLRPDPELSDRVVWMYGLRGSEVTGLRGLRAVYSPRWLYGCSDDAIRLLRSGIEEEHPLRAMSFETNGKDPELVDWLSEVKDHLVVMVTDRDDAAYQIQIFIMPRCKSEECLLAEKPEPKAESP